MLSTASSKLSEDKMEWLNIPVVIGDRSFDEEREAAWVSETFQRVADQLHRHTAEWQENVKRMRDNFVRLHPVDADHATTSAADVIVEWEKIPTLFFEYPSQAADDDGAMLTSVETQSSAASTRYQVRFDVSAFQATSVTVTAEQTAVIVRAISTSSGQGSAARVSLQPGVQRSRLRAFLSADRVLTVEAPLAEEEVEEAPQTTSVGDNVEDTGTGSKWIRAKSLLKADGKTPDGTEQPCNGEGAADVTSSAEGQAGAPSKEKVGVPIFRDELGTRRMYLAVEIGTIYRPRDVIIQVVKENRILIRAKTYEKTTEMQCKNKFTKDYELGEKIETFSLQGGLSAEGKLIISAYAKGHGPADE